MRAFAPEGWFKATASSGNGTGCIEINFAATRLVGLRDSKHPQGGLIVLTPPQWRAFLHYTTR